MTNKKALITILITVVLDIVGLGFIIPALPFIVKNFGFGEEFVGLTYGIFSLGLLLGGVIFGRLSDIYGRKSILKITVLLNIVGYLVFAFSPNLWVFIFARFLSGLGGSGWAIGQAYISDISSESERTKNMGLIGATFGIGFIIGPLFGAIIDTTSVFLLGIIPFCVIFLNLLLIYFYLPETNKLLSKANKEEILPLDFHYNKTQLLGLFFTTFSVGAIFSGMQTTFALLINDKFGYGQNVIGYLFVYIGICSVLYQSLGIKHIRKIFDEKKMIMLGLTSLTISFIGFAFNNIFGFLFLLLIFNALGMGNINPAIASLISKKAKNETGKAMGTNSSSMSLGNIIGAIIAGYLYSISISLPYLFGAMVFLSLLLFVNRFIKK
nr:MFS transporter [Candidatus Gracilibacteria bacterium]